MSALICRRAASQTLTSAALDSLILDQIKVEKASEPAAQPAAQGGAARADLGETRRLSTQQTAVLGGDDQQAEPNTDLKYRRLLMHLLLFSKLVCRGSASREDSLCVFSVRITRG
jgi:hypothetical protein